ncbi:MAG: GNAT family N-acetyltransferase [Dermatophilaceae bacterium]
MSVILRPARVADGPILTEMLVAAAWWRPDGPDGTVEKVMSQPTLAHYVQGWPRTGDRGLVAESEHPVGAVWIRFFAADDPGFGFVDPTVPELSIGVVERYRGQGVGRRLLVGLIDDARRHGVEAISLSVETDNHARHLYEQVGFRTVTTADGSVTMLLPL